MYYIKFVFQTRSLVNIHVKPERKKEIQKNQDKILMMLNLPPTDTALFVNGIFFDMDVVDIFTILETVRQEMRVMEGLYKIGNLEYRLELMADLEHYFGVEVTNILFYE